MSADRWDFYEITFSLAEHLNEDDALVIHQELLDDDRVIGAAMSCGNDSDRHPFSKAAVERAAKALCKVWWPETRWEDWPEKSQEKFRKHAALAAVALTNSEVPDAA